MKGWLEYAAVWLLLKALGLLPRSLARQLAAKVAGILYALSPKLRKTAETNLRIAFPEWTDARRDADPKVHRCRNQPDRDEATSSGRQCRRCSTADPAAEEKKGAEEQEPSGDDLDGVHRRSFASF